MTRRQNAAGWCLHDSHEQTARNADLSPTLHELCGDAEEAGRIHEIRMELVEGLRREQMLHRINDRLGRTHQPDHLRYTRRAWLELQGRRHTISRVAAAVN